MRLTRGRLGLWAVGLAVIPALVASAFAATADDDAAAGTYRDGFEMTKTAWRQEQTDANVTIQEHDRSSRAAHEGRTSEHFRFEAGVGSAFFYSYSLPKIPVVNNLKLGLYIRSNRAGVQLFARVILPGDTDPETGQPSFVLVPGTIYEDADRWQRLELLNLPASIEEQARVLRATSRRKVSLDGAYVEQIIVNLYSGQGPTEVFVDELNVTPVPAKLATAGEAGSAPTVKPDEKPTIHPPDMRRARAAVRLDNNLLKKRGDDGLYHEWIPTGIVAPGADVTSLRNAGFDLWVDDIRADPKRAKLAVDRGFKLMPRVGRDAQGKLPDADAVFRAAESYPLRDSVAFWDLGDHLGRGVSRKVRDQELKSVRGAQQRLQDLPDGVSNLVTGIVDDELRLYARGGQTLNLLGIRPPSWGSSIGPGEMFSFLKHRRDLTSLVNGGAMYWSLIPATAPPAVPIAIWGRDVPPAWGYPAVQPEQLRLMTYATLAAGYRGIVYQGDAELTRPDGPGRMLWLELAILNAEIDLAESILGNGADPIPIYYAYDPDPPALPAPGSQVGQRAPVKPEAPPLPGIKAAGIGLPYRKGVLILMADYAGNSQFQPPQATRNNVKLTITVPEGALAYQVSPGRFSAIEESEKYVGGRRLTLPEFDTTAMLLVTTDSAMARRVEAVVNAIRPEAARMAIEQAELKLAWVTEIVGMLASQGHYLLLEKEVAKRAANGGSAPTDQNDLLMRAGETIKKARESLEREDYANAWADARRASRPLRILMSGHFNNAMRAMTRANTVPEDIVNEDAIYLGKVKKKGPLQIVPPVASPPLVAFNTLPQHYIWVDMMKEARFSKNLVPSGSFDDPESLEEMGWVNQSVEYEGVATKLEPFPKDKPETGPRKRWLYFAVNPADLSQVDQLSPSLNFPAVAIRSPAVKMRAGEFYRISVDVVRRISSAPGPGGIVIRDSIGGEPLQFSSTDPIPAFTKVILYRRAPEDGELTVTLGLAGYGGAFFDDFRVERAEAPGNSDPDPSDLAGPPAAVPSDVRESTPTARREAGSRRPNR